jgi:hypothetical protein
MVNFRYGRREKKYKLGKEGILIKNFFENRILPAIKFNTLGFRTNSLWSNYLENCRNTWGGKNLKLVESRIVKITSEMKRDGLAVIDSLELNDLSDAVNLRFREQLEKEGLSEFPEYISLPPELQLDFTESVYSKLLKVSPIIENFFKSHFQPYWIATYRTQPGSVKSGSSFSWHMDNNPKEYMKIFFYLNDVKESNGAFRAVKKKSSRYLILRGFRSNSEALKNGPMVDNFLRKFPNTLKVLEGKKGTVIFFDNNLVHKGTLPEQGTRTVMSIAMIPSLKPFTKIDVEKALTSPRVRDYPIEPTQNDFGGLLNP